MREKLFLYWLILIVICTGCVSTIQKTPGTITITPTPPIIIRPLLSRWEIIDLPTISTQDYSLVIYALRITGQDTILIYSMTGLSIDHQVDLSKIAHLQDDKGGFSDAISAGTLAKLDTITFGYIKFSPRHPGAEKLDLQVGQALGKTGSINLPVAKFSNPPENPSIFNIRTYLLGTNQVIEQNGYRISFFGWVAPPFGNPTTASDEGEAGQVVTPTPRGITPIPTILPKGVTVSNEATLQIDDQGGRIFYLYVQFLSDGEIISQLI